jgi:chemotaxis protein MotB
MLRPLANLSLLVCVCSGVSTAQAGPTSEQIYFLHENGRHALIYKTMRTDYVKSSIWLREKEGKISKENMGDYLYIYPDDYKWSEKSPTGYNILEFSGGNHASLEEVDFDERGVLEVNNQGEFTFTNVKKRQHTPDNHFGVWTSPENYQKLAYSWVFPKNLEPVSFVSNRTGDWVRRKNTITYYGEDVNDLVFTIKYRPRSNGTFKALKDKLEKDDMVNVEQSSSGVKVTLEETLLFPSGVARLSPEGQTVLSKIAQTLKAEGRQVGLVVAGHTDSVPITGSLASKYPTNWELSGARAFAVVHFLADKGIAESRIEARAFGSQRPRVANKTAAGRARNRRIELFIQHADQAIPKG